MSKAQTLAATAKVMLGFGALIEAGDAGRMEEAGEAAADLALAFADFIEVDPVAAAQFLRGMPSGIRDAVAKRAAAGAVPK